MNCRVCQIEGTNLDEVTLYHFRSPYPTSALISGSHSPRSNRELLTIGAVDG